MFLRLKNLKKTLIFLSFLLLFFFISIPTNAAPCTGYDSTQLIRSDFGASYDVLSAQRELLLKADCDSNQVKIEIGSGKSTQYIYKYGWIWRNSKWEQITFTPSGSSLDVWLIGRAGLSVSLTAEEMEKDNYFLAYVCTWTGTTWKCGCRDALCAQNYWQLQKFKHTPPACTENWTCTDWSTCQNNTQSRTCTDQNQCGTTLSKPATSQSCTVACTENWTCTDWSTCQNNTQTRTCTDQNQCGTISAKPIISQSCTEACSENWTCTDWSTCQDSIQSRTCTDNNNCGTVFDKPALSQTCTMVSTCKDNDGDGYDDCDIGEYGDDGKKIDCDDNEVYAYPDGTETCDTVDNNCNGVADELCDKDRDYYCDINMTIYRNNTMCPLTIVSNYEIGQKGDDCNDDNQYINPGITEICGNGIDEDCSGADQVCPDTTEPIIYNFSVNPNNAEEGTLITAYYSAGDDNGLSRIELWRTSQDSLCVTGKESDCNWFKISENIAQGNEVSGTLVDTPPQGVHWYGLHVVDLAENIGHEPTPPGILKVDIQSISYRDVIYKGSHALDVYPASQIGKPVFLLVHGGGWYTGDKNEQWYIDLAEYLSSRGINVININYTLATEINPSYPEALEDIDCALRWIVAKSNSYGFDLNQLYIGGASAGGHLALLYTLNRESYSDNNCTWPSSNPTIKKMAGMVSPTDLNHAYTYADMNIWKNWFVGYNSSLLTEASPANYLMAHKEISYLLLHAEDDSMVDFSQANDFYNNMVSLGYTVQKVFSAQGDHMVFTTLNSHSAVFEFLSEP